MDHIICGDEVQTLQIVLQPRHKLTIDMNSLCWCTNTLVLQSRGPFFARLLAANITIGDAINETSSPAVLSLNQLGSGKILVLTPEKPLYCFKESFVCATEEIIISPKVLPFDLSLTTIAIHHIFYKAHYCCNSSTTNTNEGKIFFQSGGTILTKELKADEALVIKFNCMVAIEESCKITIVNPFSNIVLMFGGKDCFLKIGGPGKIYFCAHNNSRKSSMNRSRFDSSTTILSNMSVLGFCMYIIAVGFSFYSLTLMLNLIALEIDRVHP
jgi:uncharacterized protein (AIM24 family)